MSDLAKPWLEALLLLRTTLLPPPSTLDTRHSTLDKQYVTKWEKPYANDMLETLAENVLVHQQLGKHSGTDLLTVTFLANDHLGNSASTAANCN